MVKRRRMTPARRAALRRAQLASARKRKGKRDKDTIGYWVAKGVRKVASKATFGISGMLTEFSRKPAKKKKKR